MRIAARALLGVSISAVSLWAAVNVCEPGPDARKALDELNAVANSRDMTKTLAEFERRYSDDIAIARRYIEFFKSDLPDELPAVRERYRARAAENPKDPAALYLAAMAMQGHDTPQAIGMLDAAKKLDPAFGWAYVSLANIYAGGKFADKSHAAENIDGYFRACPDSTYSSALSLLGRFGSVETQIAVARRLRERLSDESDRAKLHLFSEVWSLEFRTHAVTDHPSLRKQVARDLKFIETRNAQPDASWLMFLKDGYKQSGASRAAVDAFDDRVLREFPSSNEALAILRRRWFQAHPEPNTGESPETWDKHLQAAVAADEEWVRRFPKVEYLRSDLFWDLTQLHPVPVERAVKIGEANLEALEERGTVSSSALEQLADFYLDNNLRAERAMELAKSEATLLDKEWRQRLERDDLTDHQLAELRNDRTTDEQNLDNLLLRAYKALGRTDDARALKPRLLGPVPQDTAQAVNHWTNLALESEIEGRKTDALAYYAAALQARGKPPEKRHGRVDDPLLEDARKLFLASGGSEAGWSVWSARLPAKNVVTAGAQWERPNRPMPPFHLADLAGKPWTLQSLQGKTVLIAVWATWCGPCMDELPHAQKLYEKTKDRHDLLVLTMNIDEELGLVEPFMREKGFTFPVLPAYGFVNKLLDSVAIPRTWILDRRGKWQWEMIGFDSSDSDPEGSMLAKLESVR